MGVRYITSNGQKITVPDYIAGHLKWEAFRDLRAGYTALTQAMHKLRDSDGGPAPDDTGRITRTFVSDAQKAASDITDALKRIEMFEHGEVNDDLIDPSQLGPKVRDDNFREVFIDDSNRQPITHIKHVSTGLRVFMGANPDVQIEGTRRGQPFVAITTDDMSEKLIAANGEPILSVNVNDADLYDNEGNGDRTKRIDRETIREILKFTSDYAPDSDEFELTVAHIQSKVENR